MPEPYHSIAPIQSAAAESADYRQAPDPLRPHRPEGRQARPAGVATSPKTHRGQCASRTAPRSHPSLEQSLQLHQLLHPHSLGLSPEVQHHTVPEHIRRHRLHIIQIRHAAPIHRRPRLRAEHQMWDTIRTARSRLVHADATWERGLMLVGTSAADMQAFQVPVEMRRVT